MLLDTQLWSIFVHYTIDKNERNFIVEKLRAGPVNNMETCAIFMLAMF